ncbi:hypothetical protein [Vibrio harveyi]|uniref:hypothetical protein n=1 Tax=Vibrio harveyi TaxID=669 RepID=UPI003CEE3B86
MNQLYIPEVNHKIRLSEDLFVTIKNEHRNNGFIKSYLAAYPLSKQDDNKNLKIIIPKGTVLNFSRIYVRQGDSSDYNSITFTTAKSDHFIKGRFFISLDDANKIKYERVIESQEKQITLKRALARKQKEINDRGSRHPWYVSERLAFEELAANCKLLHSYTVKYSYRKAIACIRLHQNQKPLSPDSQALFEELLKLKDVEVECLKYDVFFSHGEFFFRISILNPLDKRLLRIFDNDLYITRRNNTATDSFKSFYDQTRFIASRAFQEEAFYWEHYPDFKKNAKNERLDNEYNLITFNDGLFSEMKKELTSIKRKLNKENG